MADKKDYILECGTEVCDGGLDCKECTNPTTSMCKRCMCAKCVRGQCQKEAK